MCGFAGVVAWDDRYRVSRETLGRMSAAIAHRGPDGEGYHLNHEQEVTADRPQIGLAFRRLAILDPDPRSNQPFTDGRHWLVFNGEIYNFRELRAELTILDPSYEWRTSGDTEVLLRAYAVWGEKCVDHLNGMFAFAVWDEHDKSLFLARDRMGQKPLYYAFCGPGISSLIFKPTGDVSQSTFSSVFFASELPALRNAFDWPASLETSSLLEYLRWGYVPAPSTINREFSQIPPGWAHTFAVDRWIPNMYFNQYPESPSIGNAPAHTRAAVERAVSRQLVSDVPLGCFLSGGTDSSIIALCMRRALGGSQRMLTFSVGFDDPRYDESPYAEAVARHIGSDHHRFVVKPNAIDDLPKLAAVFGEPFADSSALPTHYLARETRRHVKVALSGDGGDELFGGYDRYRAMQLGERLHRVPARVRKMVAETARRMRDSHPKSRVSRLKRFAATLHEPAADRYTGYLRLFDEITLAELFPDPLFKAAGPRWYYDVFVERGRDPVRAALATDRMSYLPDDLLAKVDRASMLHALEVRSPFMDHELVRFAAGLTTDQLLKGGPKRMLREAFAKDLPDFVFKRKKMGFAVPIGEWFRGELRPMLRDHLFAADSFAKQHFNVAVVERFIEEHERERVDHSQRLYALLMLELWWRLQRP